MDPRTDERRLSTASSADSLVFYLNGGPPPKKVERGRKRRRRACPVLAFLGLLIHFLSAGCGVALSVIIVRFGLQVTSAGTQDIVGRILVFVASCMGLFYILMHAFAAREQYVRSHVGAHLFNFFSVAVAMIIMRIALPVWIAAVVMSALVAANQGFAVEEGVQGNVIWIQLGIAALGLLSIFLMIMITERTDRPFATSIFSKKRFIMGISEIVKRTDTFDMSVSRQGFQTEEKKRTTVLVTRVDGMKDDGRDSVYDRSMIVTPTSADDDEELPVPTVPAMPAMPEWRQKRDAALRNTLRADDARSIAVPSALTAVYGRGSPASSQDSLKQYGSHFSWRPPTRDSTTSRRNSRNMVEYNSNWPPTPLQNQDDLRSPNRASAPPPSQPPTVPLPPILPPPHSDSGDLAETAKLAGGVRESQASIETTSTLPDIRTTSTPDTQPTTMTEEEGPGPSEIPDEQEQPVEEKPVEEPTRARGRRPALPSLAKLSARAAARHNRTSMLAREKKLEPKPQPEPQPEPEHVEESSADDIEKTVTSRSSSPEPNSRSRKRELHDTDSGFESEEDTGPEEPRRSRHRSRSLLRNNTAGQRLVRNFSRPRVPSSLLNRRRPSEGNLPGMAFAVGQAGHRRNSNRNSGNAFSTMAQQFRRSRSLPADRARANKAQEPETDVELEPERNNLVEIDPHFQVKVPIIQAAPVPKNTQKSAAAAQKKAIPPAPRFSPFPSAATSMAPEKKVKGLGPGSIRRLEERVTQWREGVDQNDNLQPLNQNPVTSILQVEREAQRQLMEKFEPRPSMDMDEDRDRGRPSMEGVSGGIRGRSRGERGQANKLSRERSMTGRARRAAQNF